MADGPEKQWLNTELAREDAQKSSAANHSLRSVMSNGRVWVLCLIYFGFVYGLYALAFFLPTIIGGFQSQFNVTFGVMEKGLITGAPYLVAAIVMYFWSRDVTRRGCKTAYRTTRVGWRNFCPHRTLYGHAVCHDGRYLINRQRHFCRTA